MTTINDLRGMKFGEVLKLKQLSIEGVRFNCKDVSGCLHVMTHGGSTVDFISGDPEQPLKSLTLVHLELAALTEI